MQHQANLTGQVQHQANLTCQMQHRHLHTMQHQVDLHTVLSPLQLQPAQKFNPMYSSAADQTLMPC